MNSRLTPDVCPGLPASLWSARIVSGQGVADIFDEVNEDLRADRARQLFTRFGGLLVLAAVLVVAAAGGWQYWQTRQTQQANQVASQFLAAMRDSAGPAPADQATPARAAAADGFARIAASGPEGYRTLARLRAAALRANAGDLPGALLLWDQLSADTEADPLLRDLANLLWVQHQVDGGDPAAVQGRLAPLVAPGNPWRPMAQEAQAWLALRTGKDDQARTLLTQLSADAGAPDGVRGRANGLLSRLGGATAPGSGG